MLTQTCFNVCAYLTNFNLMTEITIFDVFVCDSVERFYKIQYVKYHRTITIIINNNNLLLFLISQLPSQRQRLWWKVPQFAEHCIRHIAAFGNHHAPCTCRRYVKRWPLNKAVWLPLESRPMTPGSWIIQILTIYSLFKITCSCR